MNKIDSGLPWSFPIMVSQIPEEGLLQVVETSPGQRADLAALARIANVAQASVDLHLKPIAGDRVHVTGHVKAVVGQICVVTLDPIENVIDESIDVIFAPASQIPATPKMVAKEEGEDAEIPDSPEPIVGGKIDLGHLATEILMLAIDPYPRKANVVFEPPVEPEDPEAHPFAALRALKAEPATPRGKKPKKH